MNVGRVTRVDGIRVSAAFYERLQPFLVTNGDSMTSPRINSFVKTGVGLDTIICQIVGEHEAEFDKKSEITKSEQVVSAGAFVVDLEVRGHISNGEFKGGLRCLPIVGATVESLDGKELAMLYSAHGAKPMRIGRSLFDETNSVYLDAGKLMASHIGVFGNTGSGKSNTLASILNRYSTYFRDGNKAAHIMVFDLNNEYGGGAIVNATHKTVYRLNTRPKAGNAPRIPLDIDSLGEDSWGTILRATQKTQMPVVRRAFYRWKNDTRDGFIQEVKQSLVDKRATLFFALRNYCEGLVAGIEDLAFNNCVLQLNQSTVPRVVGPVFHA